LAAEPSERDVMRRPPRPPQEALFAQGLGLHVVWLGVLMAGLALGTQVWFFEPDSPHWQTMVFAVLGFSQLAHVLAIRSERESLLAQGLLSNAPLAAAVGLTVALQLAVIYIPPLNEVFATEPLSFGELAVALAISALVFVAVEIEKWVKRSAAASPPSRTGPTVTSAAGRSRSPCGRA
jgi:P-type Ca2+ transporter type 2C